MNNNTTTYAGREIQADIKKEILSHRKSWKELSIHRVVEEGRREALERLIADGANVNARDREHCTPLHMAAMTGKRDMAEILLNNGAKVNARNSFLETPLHWAENSDMARLLVSFGAHMNAKDSYFTKPKDWAQAMNNRELHRFYQEQQSL